MVRDTTHEPSRRSWVKSANGHADFPIQNLPLGVFAPPAGAPRGGVAIGDMILDLAALHEAKLLTGDAQAACRLGIGPMLNGLFAAGAAARRALRAAVSALLVEGSPKRPDLLHRAADCRLCLPAQVLDFTDFYAGIHHASNAGKLFRPTNPLLPNYKWLPIGYHGRASSVRVSGEEVRRPRGQRKDAAAVEPSFGASQRLDYELELGIWVGPGNRLGAPIPISEACNHIVGYCLLNDWSARDIQAWEYQPLGPFLAKSFSTSISPWIITPEALAPFRAAQATRPQGDPEPLAYLWDEPDQRAGALDLEFEALLLTPEMHEHHLEPYLLSRVSTRHMYWTPAQLVAHHSSNGCNLQAGDLFGSGTLSAPTEDGFGSLLEITQDGRRPIALPSGETRGFLADGDEVILRAHARRDGFQSIGFGECRGIITPQPVC